MGLGAGPLFALFVVAVSVAGLVLRPLRDGVTADRRRIALVVVGISTWFVVWPGFDSGEHGLAGFALVGLWLFFFVPGAGLGMLAGFALARSKRWGGWLAAAWAVVTLGWASLVVIVWFVSSGTAPSLGPSHFYRAVFLSSHFLLLLASLLTIALLARDHRAGMGRP